MSRSCAQLTTCASTAAPMQQEAAAVRTAPWEPEQAAADLLLAEPQKRQGVPVYVMLPLDTVSPSIHHAARTCTAPLLHKFKQS